MACASQLRCCYAAAMALLLLLGAPQSHCAPSACTSGVLQLIPPPQASNGQYDPCYSPANDQNSLKAICGAAYRVTVAKGIIRTVPLELGSVMYSGPDSSGVLNCKDLNASGLFNPGSTTAATLMLYDNKGGPLSNFSRSSPNRVSLVLGRTYSQRPPSDNCTLNYAVVSGCVLGVKATPSSKPFPCPPGTIRKTGRFGLKYCTACPPGTYSPGGAAATRCIPCPIGTASRYQGVAKCPACTASSGSYASKPGLLECQYCGSLLYDNKWTDGKTRCGTCPKGSIALPTKPQQCVRCYAGKKCCTVNPDKDCPLCTDNATPATYTSIFALESATPTSCLAATSALCSPKINITIDGTCTVSINNMGYNPKLGAYSNCPWSESWPIKGAAADALVDLAQVGNPYQSDIDSLIDGNVTAAASPYLTITIPKPKCAFRFRALTAPAATILGIAPKPNTTPPSACPAGSYIDTSTDTKPGPCLPCPPGTYSTSNTNTTAGACIPCAPGTFAGKFGSTSCTKCPAGRVSEASATACVSCYDVDKFLYPNAAATKCIACPANSGSSFEYRGTGTCLGDAYGTTCCAAGACQSGQRRCSGALTRLDFNLVYHTILRLKSRSLSSPNCRNATFLSCLPTGAKVAIVSRRSDFGIELQPTTTTRCATNTSYTLRSLRGGIVASNRAVLQGNDPFGDDPNYLARYELLTKGSSSSVTMYLSPRTLYSADTITPTPDIIKECSATFELLTGYFLDLRQAPTATCPAAAITTKVSGRTFCTYCSTGRFKNKKGKCEKCPAGTYQPEFDGAACKPCPAGYSCRPNSNVPQPCSRGSFSAAPRSTRCSQCPKGTFSPPGVASKGCSKCPKGTIAPPGSSTCAVAWATKF